MSDPQFDPAVQAGTHPIRPRGARPTPRHRLARARPFQAYATPPSAWIWLPAKLSYWLNDVDGDCVTAEEAFARATSGILIYDATVQAWAQAHGVLDGAEIDQVLDWMAASGFSQDGNVYGCGQKSSVDWTDAPTLQAAIAQGPVKIGAAADQLQNVVGSSNGWVGVGFSADSNIDHDPSLCGYGTAQQILTWLGVQVPSGIDPNVQGYAVFTWRTIGFLDAASMLAITGEAWLRTPTTVVIGTAPPSPDIVFTPGPVPPPTPPTPPIPPIPPLPPPTPTGDVALAIAAAITAYQAALQPQPSNQTLAQIIRRAAELRSGTIKPKAGFSNTIDPTTPGTIFCVSGSLGSGSGFYQGYLTEAAAHALLDFLGQFPTVVWSCLANAVGDTQDGAGKTNGK